MSGYGVPRTTPHTPQRAQASVVFRPLNRLRPTAQFTHQHYFFLTFSSGYVLPCFSCATHTAAFVTLTARLQFSIFHGKIQQALTTPEQAIDPDESTSTGAN